MSGRDLSDVLEPGLVGQDAEMDKIPERHVIPLRWFTRPQESFDFRRKEDFAVQPGMEERLDPKPITRRVKTLLAFVPEDQGKLSTKLTHELQPVLLIEMHGDLAVRFGAEAVATSLKVAFDRLVAVELSVHDDENRSIFIADWLLTVIDSDDCQSGVPQPDIASVR